MELNEICKSVFSQCVRDQGIIPTIVADIAHRCENSDPDIWRIDFDLMCEEACNKMNVIYTGTLEECMEAQWRKMKGKANDSN